MENKLIVIKIGTTSLTKSDGSISPDKIAELVRQVSELKNLGHRVVVVTSGAIAAGFRRLGYQERPVAISAKQAAAAVGQGLLIEEYSKQFLGHGFVCGQLLLNRTDFADKRRYQNVFNTLSTLLKRGAVPIINENDTVSIEELKFGDNDTLSAHVAALVHADLLILLTDVDGLYTADPQKDSGATRIDVVDHIGDDIDDMALGSSSKTGTGGMKSKINAARLATASGVPVFVCSSGEKDVLIKAVAGGAEGTSFNAQSRVMNTREQWLAFHSDVSGSLIIDDGAVKALKERHTSLLPSGIVDVKGDFWAGDVVDVVDKDFKFVGRGMVEYNAKELEQIKGMSSRGIRDIISDGRSEAINRDNWIGSETGRALTKGDNHNV